MALRTNIEGITDATCNWTCKVQIVDISRERQSPVKKIRFQNLILEDEQEQQVRAVIYADDIDDYAEKLTLLNTYLISAANVKPTNELEKPLPPPTKLNITTFDSIAQMTPGPNTEIDMQVSLKIGVEKLLFVMNGIQLEAKMEKGKEFPVILGRNIGLSPYQGFSLQTRFNSTIRINPTYPQALELITWAKTNKDMLSSDAPANFAGSSALIVNPIHQPIIPITEITTATSVGVFYIEAEISIANDLQDFCMLECSGCKQKKRIKERKEFDCPKCQQKTTLVPWCTFQIDLVDGSGATTTSISGDLAEKMLSMTAEDIYDTTCAKVIQYDVGKCSIWKISIW